MDYYICKTLYLSLIVTTKQKTIVDSQKNKEKGTRAHSHRKSPIHKGRQQVRKKKKYFGTTKQKAINRMGL